MSELITNYGIIAAYLLLAVAVVGAIGFPILEIAKNPKGAKGALIGVGLLVLVFGISYVLGSEENLSKIEISGGTAKLVDTGMFAFYILALAAVGVTIYSEVSKIFK
jgi:hypothetical protein